MDAWECSLDEAVAEAPLSFRAMHTMAQAMQQRHREIDRCRTERQWLSGLKSHVYHTHIAISGQYEGTLTRLAELFYHTASQPALPWYPAFLGGQSKAVSIAPGDGVEQQQLCERRKSSRQKEKNCSSSIRIVRREVKGFLERRCGLVC